MRWNLIFAAFLLGIAGVASCQELVPQATLSFHGGGHQALGSMPPAVALPDGSLIIGMPSMSGVGGLRKYSSAGELIWTTQPPYYLYRIVADADGSVYGMSVENVHRYSPTGGLMWQSQNLPRSWLDFQLNPDGGVLVLTQNAINSGLVDLWSINPAGTAVKLYSVPHDGELMGYKIVSANELYLAGRTKPEVTDEGTEQELKTWTGSIARFGSQGSLVWKKTWPNYQRTFLGEYSSKRVEDVSNPIGSLVPVWVWDNKGSQPDDTESQKIGQEFLDRSSGELKRTLLDEDYARVGSEAENTFGESRMADGFFYQVSMRVVYHEDSTDIYPRTVSRRDLAGNPFWSFDSPDNWSTKEGFVYRDEFWWTTYRSSGSFLQRVNINGRLIGSATIPVSFLGPIFHPAGNTLWITGTSGPYFIAQSFRAGPYAVRDDYNTDANTSLSVDAEHGVLANDELAVGATAVLQTPPANGTVTLNSDGSFQYTPKAGYKGFDNITYYFMKDGKQSNSQIFAIAVGTFAFKHAITPSQVVGGNPVVGKVTLNRPAPASGYTVGLQSTTSAISVPPSVFIPGGASEGTYTLNTTGVAADVTRSVIATGDYVPLHAQLRLMRASLGSLILAPISLVGGKSSSLTLVLDGKTPSTGGTVPLSDNSDAVNTPASAQIPGNSESLTVAISTKPVAQDTVCTILATYGNSISRKLTVLAPRLEALTVSSNPASGGSTVVGKVFLNGIAAINEVVSLSDNSSALTTPPSVSVAPGTSSAAFSIEVAPTSTAYSRVVYASHRGLSKLISISVVPSKLDSVTVSPNVVKGGVTTTGLVQFTGAVSTSTIVNLSSNSAAVHVPSSVLIAAKSQKSTFAIQTSRVSATATRQVAASHAGVIKTATITLTP